MISKKDFMVFVLGKYGSYVVRMLDLDCGTDIHVEFLRALV